MTEYYILHGFAVMFICCIYVHHRHLYYVYKVISIEIKTKAKYKETRCLHYIDFKRHVHVAAAAPDEIEHFSTGEAKAGYLLIFTLLYLLCNMTMVVVYHNNAVVKVPRFPLQNARHKQYNCCQCLAD